MAFREMPMVVKVFFYLFFFFFFLPFVDDEKVGIALFMSTS